MSQTVRSHIFLWERASKWDPLPLRWLSLRYSINSQLLLCEVQLLLQDLFETPVSESEVGAVRTGENSPNVGSSQKKKKERKWARAGRKSIQTLRGDDSEWPYKATSAVLERRCCMIEATLAGLSQAWLVKTTDHVLKAVLLKHGVQMLQHRNIFKVHNSNHCGPGDKRRHKCLRHHQWRNGLWSGLEQLLRGPRWICKDNWDKSLEIRVYIY